VKIIDHHPEMRTRPPFLRLQLAYIALLFISLFQAFPQSTLSTAYGIQVNKSVPSASDFALTIPLEPIAPWVDWTMKQENKGILPINVTSIGNFSSQVTLEVSGIPLNSTGSLSPAQVAPPAGGSVTSTFTLSTDWRTPVGLYNLTITGTSAVPPITHTITVTLFISADGDFVIDAEPRKPSLLVVHQGQCGNYNITVRRIGNFSAPVTLKLANSTDQINWQFLPSDTVTREIGIVSFSTLQICVRNNAAPGNLMMTVEGEVPASGSSITHSVAVSLEIPAPVKAVDWEANRIIIGLSGAAVCIIAILMLTKRLPRIRSLLRGF
jgi:hypothetical protein